MPEIMQNAPSPYEEGAEAFLSNPVFVDRRIAGCHCGFTVGGKVGIQDSLGHNAHVTACAAFLAVDGNGDLRIFHGSKADKCAMVGTAGAVLSGACLAAKSIS